MRCISAGERYEPNVLAYATGRDGVHWDKLPANLSFIGSKEHPHEQDRVGACQVVKADGWHYMFYIGCEDRIVASKLNNSKRH